jgi:hypothetical protein
VQPKSFKSIALALPIKIYLGVILSTAFVYLLLDLAPVLQLFPNTEARIVQVLWQSSLWGIYSIFIAFYISYGLGLAYKLHETSFLNFFVTFFPEYLSTKLRAIIKTTLWGLLFIIPGFVMALRYSLSEMVVFFNPNFLVDRTQDPLTISAEKIGFKVPILFLLAFLFFVLPSVFDSSFDHAHFLYEPYPRFAQIALYSFLNLFTYIYLFKIFYKFEEKQNV